MNVRRAISALHLVLGLLIVIVGIVHFVMMSHLVHMITRLAGQATTDIIPIFYVNHIGSGVFLLVIGGLVIGAAGGLRQGRSWARNAGLIYGAGLGVLGAVLWMTVPPLFLTAAPFRFALISLMLVGILAGAPLLIFRKDFNEN